MKTILLEATDKHPTKQPGTEYEANQAVAMVDLMRGHAVGKRRAKIVVEESSGVRFKRRYRRRDMQAEN